MFNKYSKLKLVRFLVGSRLVDKLVFARNYYRFNKMFVWPDLKRGERFNEKLLHLKHNPGREIDSALVDKLKVRNFIKEKIGEEYLIKLYGAWGSNNEVDIASLPDKCVLKANHISGDVQIIKDRAQIPEALDALYPLLKRDYANYSGEEHYRGIEPYILAEELLGDGRSINDYKFFCFNGVPKYIQVDFDRFADHRRTFFDPAWNNLKFSTLYPVYESEISPPNNLSEMLKIATLLSQGYEFLRVDLYEVDGRVYFGELTFNHGNGVEPFRPDEFDFTLGNDLTIVR